MFAFLRINDLAIIQSLELELDPGFTVLTGETGAGKSIILAAVDLLLGQRATAELIRQGSPEAVVEALFILPPQGEMAARLQEAGLEDGLPEGELVLKRVVSRQGRNRVQVSGSLATLGQLALLGPELVSLSGQHANQILLKPEQHLLLLDAYAGLDQQRRALGRAVEGLLELDRAMEELSQALAQREARREWLELQIKELDEAQLDPDQEAQLKQECQRLANAEQIAGLAEQAHQGLYASEGSALETLGRVRGLLAELRRLDNGTGPLADRLEEAFFQMEDLAGELQGYAASLVFDPGRLDWVEGRLHQIQRITRKYGGTVAEALASLESARQELAGLEQGQDRLDQLRAERAQALELALELALKLSDQRRRAAPKLARAVEAELAELGMAGCQFQVNLAEPSPGLLQTPKGSLSRLGLEQAEFRIAPNPGEGLRRLARIASGGELSRVLLALKGLLAQQQGAPTLIFDEVDAGIGGSTGAVVGAKLAALSRRFQVLCITHLPQIAAWADHHLAVVKRTRQGRTATELNKLDKEGRLAELARMLGGAEGPQAAAGHAAQMLAAAAREKEKLGAASG